METFLKFLDKTEGRDKFLKFFQYFGRFLRALFTNNLSIRFMNLSYSIRFCRQFFRLGKSLQEFQLIQKILKKESMDNVTRLLDILHKASLCTRWLFDNFSVLSAYKIIQMDHREFTKAATTAWVFALLLSLTNCSREMMKSYAREAMLKETAVGKTTRWVVENLDDLSETRRKLILEIAKNVGDLIIASNGALIPYRILGKQFSEKWVGVGGMVSAGISVYQVWENL